MGVFVSGLVAFTFYRSFIIFFFLLPIGLAYPLYRVKSLKKKRLLQLSVQFKEGIVLLASFLSAGYSIENAFGLSTRELGLLYGENGLITREFDYLSHQIRINRSVEQALMEFAGRSGLEDVKNFAEVFAVAKRSGGELVPIMNHTVAIIHDKGQIQEEIITLTSSKQFEQKIMNLLPFLIIIYIEMSSPGFFDLMYTTGVGRIIMTVCLAAYLLAYVISGKILDIEI